MKILYWPQLSMRSYRDQRWLVDTDAQVTKMKAYVEALPADWQWSWCLPFAHLCDSRQLHDLVEEWRPDNVHFYQFPWMHNVLQGRYFFPMDELRVLVEHVKPDVMLLEVPEHARAVRVVQQMSGQDFPVVSMVEHVDFYEQTRVPEKVGYTMRQIDGALASDVTAFPLQGMHDEWLKAAGSFIKDDRLADMFHPEIGSTHLEVWNAIYSPAEVESHLEPDDLAEWHETRPDKRPVINFISRLSDNQRTHYREFFEACNQLAADGVEFQVWVANPNEAMSKKDILASCPNVTKVGNGGRAEYIQDLWRSDIVPILYPQSHIYSLGFCEAITADNLILTATGPTPVRYGPFLACGYVSPDIVADGLVHLLSVHKHEDLRLETSATQLEWLMKDRSVEQNVHKVKTTIEEVTK